MKSEANIVRDQISRVVAHEGFDRSINSEGRVGEYDLRGPDLVESIVEAGARGGERGGKES